MSGRLDPDQLMFGFVTARKFYGMDINPFAVEMAKVTMMIARKLAIDELHITEQALPLDNLDENFTAADALIDELGQPGPMAQGRCHHRQPAVPRGEAAQAGARRRLRQRGPPRLPRSSGHGRLLRLLVPQGPRPSAAMHARRPVAGRAGLVGTQNIRNNQSRVGGLDYIVQTGTIVEAVDNQPWSGEANVHVSIANWVKTQDAALLPSTRRLWFKVEPSPVSKLPRTREGRVGRQGIRTDFRECDHINSALSDQIDVSEARVLKCNIEPQRCFNGQIPGTKGSWLPGRSHRLLDEDARERRGCFSLHDRQEMLTHAHLKRWVIDFQMRIARGRQLSQHCDRQERVFELHQEYAIRERETRPGRNTGQDQNWLADAGGTSFGRREEMISVIEPPQRYIACSIRPSVRYLSLCITDSSGQSNTGFSPSMMITLSGYSNLTFIGSGS